MCSGVSCGCTRTRGCRRTAQKCGPFFAPGGPGKKPGGGIAGIIAGATDPNNKYGSTGAGTAQFVTGADPLGYQVDFENEATATLAAQRVVVTDQLDTAHLDLSTFELGPINFGDTLLAPPANAQSYSSTVDLRPATNALVQVDAALDTASGLLTYTFQTLDPATGQPPVDPTLGFLPPDVNPPAGDGSMFYTVKAKPGLSTGTVISNQAIVYFDNNPPINTPAWTNTIDNDLPVSKLKKLAGVVTQSKIKLKVVGSDVGSGIGQYDIYASDDGGPFALLLSREPGPKIIFNGTTGHTYKFFSRAHDAAGNAEPLKTAAEAKTRIIGPDLIGTWNAVNETMPTGGREKLKGSFVVTNQSPTEPTTAGSVVSFYLSDDATLDDQDTLIGESAAFGTLAPGGMATVKLPTFKLPAGIAATGKYVLAVIDPANAVTETDKSNNTVAYGPLP